MTYSANRVTAPRRDVLSADEAVYKVQSPAAIPAGNHTLAVWFKIGPAAPIRSKRLPAYGHLNYELPIHLHVLPPVRRTPMVMSG